MDCKKGPEYSKKCQCLKRKHGGCAECEKKAIKVVYESGRDLNETIEFVKESGKEIDDLYVAVVSGESSSVGLSRQQYSCILWEIRL